MENDRNITRGHSTATRKKLWDVSPQGASCNGAKVHRASGSASCRWDRLAHSKPQAPSSKPTAPQTGLELLQTTTLPQKSLSWATGAKAPHAQESNLCGRVVVWSNSRPVCGAVGLLLGACGLLWASLSHLHDALPLARCTPP